MDSVSRIKSYSIGDCVFYRLWLNDKSFKPTPLFWFTLKFRPMLFFWSTPGFLTHANFLIHLVFFLIHSKILWTYSNHATHKPMKPCTHATNTTRICIAYYLTDSIGKESIKVHFKCVTRKYYEQQKILDFWKIMRKMIL